MTSKIVFISILSIMLLPNVFAQQLQERDLNPVDLDSIDIDTYLEQELSVDEPPIFKGKNADFKLYLATHLVYPQDARDKFIAGVVYVMYIIDTDGKVKDVRVMQSPNPTLDKAAIDVVAHSPKWKPATVNGKAVRYRKVSKIIFRL